MNRIIIKLILLVALFPMVAMAITVPTGGSAPAAGSDPNTVHTGGSAPAAGSDPTTVHTGSAAPAVGPSAGTVPTGASAPAIGAPATSTTVPTGASAPAAGGTGTSTTVPTGAAAPAVGGPGTATTVPTGPSAPAPGPTSSVAPGLTPGTTVLAAVAPVSTQAAAAAPAKVARESSKQVQAQAWQIIPAQSSIQFVGMLNDAPVTGQFKRFSGDIHFDPANLAASHVKVVVEIGSLSTSYRDIEDTLKTGDWLGMNLFPKAVFESSTFAYVKEGQFRADGLLTIRDRTLPFSVMFTASDVPPNNKKVLGTGVIKRTAFGLGRGEWAAVGNVSDDITINFSLVARKK